MRRHYFLVLSLCVLSVSGCMRGAVNGDVAELELQKVVGIEAEGITRLAFSPDTSSRDHIEIVVYEETPDYDSIMPASGSVENKP